MQVRGVTSSHSEEQHLQSDTNISRHTEEQHLQSAECWLKTQAVCKTFQPNVDTFNANVVIGKRKYPVTNSKELLCKKDNYPEKNNQLDCFDSKEPHNDDVNSVILSDSERSHKRGDFTNFAILRFTQNDRKIAFTLAEGATHVALSNNSRKMAFTEPSRGMSGAKVEQTSAETLSFRCVCERCRLTRGDVGKLKCKVAFNLAETLITLGIIGVVAALTIPTVINKIKHKELEAGFKSAYSTFSQGFMNMKTEDGEGLSKNYTYYDRENDIYPNKKEFENKFYKYSKLKSIGVCNYGGKKIRNYNGTKVAIAYAPNINLTNKYLLSNGMCFYSTINASRIILFVDTNGTKGPNKLGHDCFHFYIDKNDKLVPFKMTKLLTDEEVENTTYPTVAGDPCSIKSNQTGNGVGCAYYAIINQNPDTPTKGYWESLP